MVERRPDGGPRANRTVAPVEPVPDEPAAVAELADGPALLIADYHAGIEAGLRVERGVEVPSRADDRRKRLLGLLERTGVSRLVVLGDLMHSIGDPGGAERGELEVLFESLPPGFDVTLVKGNHDGAIESWLPELTVVPGDGARFGAVGACHGHTWPSREALAADVVCMGHEHPCVRLEDEVGGRRVESAWLRGRLAARPFCDRSADDGIDWLDGRSEPESDGNASERRSDAAITERGSDAGTSGRGSDAAITERGSGAGTSEREANAPMSPGDAPELIVLPAFNELAGGTWVNVADQSFLAPFLPAGLADGEAYLLDGTRLGPYRSV